MVFRTPSINVLAFFFKQAYISFYYFFKSTYFKNCERILLKNWTRQKFKLKTNNSFGQRKVKNPSFQKYFGFLPQFCIISYRVSPILFLYFSAFLAKMSFCSSISVAIPCHSRSSRSFNFFLRISSRTSIAVQLICASYRKCFPSKVQNFMK